jgi:hypothetical protein
MKLNLGKSFLTFTFLIPFHLIPPSRGETPGIKERLWEDFVQPASRKLGADPKDKEEVGYVKSDFEDKTTKDTKSFWPRRRH